MVGLPPIRYSPGGNRPDDAADCSRLRSRRRTRFLVTAGPRARPSANATRGGVSLPCGSSTNVHHRTPARIRLPSTVRRPKERRSRIRQIKPTDGGGPWRAGPSARRGHQRCSCGCGSHASWHGDDCWVGRCASRSPPRAAHGSTHGVDIHRSERWTSADPPRQTASLRSRDGWWQPNAPVPVRDPCETPGQGTGAGPSRTLLGCSTLAV